jgi:YD repeat-containing protein
MNNLYQELTVINAFSDKSESYFFADYVTPPSYIQELDPKLPGSSRLNTRNTFADGFYPQLRFSFTSSRNRLFTIDENNQQRTIAEIVNPFTETNNTNSSFVYVQPGFGLPQIDALREHCSDGRLGKAISLSPWMNQSTHCPSSFADPNACYDLISLQASVSDPVPCGEITLHTVNTRSKQIIMREIVLEKAMVSKIKSHYINYATSPDLYGMRNAINFKWILPDFLANSPIKVNFQLRFNEPQYIKHYGAQYTFEYVVGRNHQTPYNGHLLPWTVGHEPTFADFNLNYLKMYVQYNGDWIPILDSNTFTMDNSVYTKPYSMPIQFISDQEPHNWTETITQYNEGDSASFQDTYTLMFYPLPETIDGTKIEIQYWDTTLPQPNWHSLPNLQYTGHAIAASAQAILPGHYSFRLRAKNLYNNYVDFSGLAEPSQENWWELGTFAVTHGGTLTSVHHTVAPEEVVRPVRQQVLDRWRNVVASTNASNHTTSTIYNGRNKALRTTQPAIEVTDEQGVVSTQSPQTHTVYDLNDEVIAVRDPNSHITRHERDKDGNALKTILADGVFKRFIPDIFGRTKKMGDPYEHYITYQHDRCNREVGRADADNWLTGFGYNELGDRLSVTINNGRETERYDFLHPSRKPTHHYLPEGDAYLTLRDYDWRGAMILERLPNGRQNTWEHDAFGNTLFHTDLGDSLTTYTRNPCYPTEVAHVHSTNKGHGMRWLADGSLHPMGEQDLTYQYDEASHEIATVDQAVSLTTLSRLDVEGRVARQTFRASDGHIHQALLMKWDAVGALEQIRDTILVAKYAYDAKRNRRAIRGSIFWNQVWNDVGKQYWYTYTESDSMKMCRGFFDTDKQVIKLGPDRGMMLLYDLAGLRHQEQTIKTDGTVIDKFLYYRSNNLLNNTISTNGEHSELQYDGAVARRKAYITNTTKQECEYRTNGWLQVERFSDGSIDSSTIYGLNSLGLPESQSTKVRSKDEQAGYDDVISTTYNSLDNYKIAGVEGVRQWTNGDKSESTVAIYNDPNGNTEVVSEPKQ